MDKSSACHFAPALRANNGLPLRCGCTPNPPDSAMQPGSVDYVDLVLQVRNYIAGSLNDDQIHAVLQFDLIKYDDKQPNGMPTRESIRRYANVFDKYFFRGLVFGYGRCDLDFCWHGMFRNRGIFGVTTEVRGCVVHKQIHAVSIRLDPEPIYYRTASIDEHINKMLCVLLHEMCHAMLLLYACKCHTPISAYLHYFGIKGHGCAFKWIYLAIMAKAKVEFDLNFDKRRDWDPMQRSEAQALEDMFLRTSGPINRWKWRNI